MSVIIDLLMGLFRGAVFHHGGVPENCPLALMGRFPSSMGPFLTLMGRFPECLNGPLFRERKTHKHKQICGIVPGLGGFQNFVYVFYFFGSFLRMGGKNT